MVLQENEGRTGRFIRQPSGYRAFIPAALPYEPPVKIDDELLFILSNADRSIGRLDAASDMLPNPELFVGTYVAKEAVLSSQIEGVTQASLAEVLEYDVRESTPDDIAEVINYIGAMNHGLQRLNELPLSNRLIREIHEKLMRGVRGEEWQPGEFRRSQNWIGPPGSTLNTASFVPPPPGEMVEAMGALESYLHDDQALTPILIKAGLIHSQLETIHPFLDGNGRMGRLLVSFYLCHQGVLKRPLLYLSAFFKEYQGPYYQHLQSTREDGNIEGWLKFFLTAVWRVAEAAARTVGEILSLREAHRALIQNKLPGSVSGVALLDHLFERPFVTVNSAADAIGVSYPTANGLIASLVEFGILRETTGRERNRRFGYESYIQLMDRGLEIEAVR